MVCSESGLVIPAGGLVARMGLGAVEGLGELPPMLGGTAVGFGTSGFLIAAAGAGPIGGWERCGMDLEA